MTAKTPAESLRVIFSPKAITPTAVESAGFKQSIKRYRRDPKRRKEAIAVESPTTTPKKAEIASGKSGVEAAKGFGTDPVADRVAKNSPEAITFLIKFNEKADPCQFLSQNMNPIAEASGEARAATRPGDVWRYPPRQVNVASNALDERGTNFIVVRGFTTMVPLITESMLCENA
jgi:hypothetical protein